LIDDRRLIPILAIGGLLILAGMGLWVWRLSAELDTLESRVWRACDEYAAPLDLAHMAGLCADVGYQQTFTPNGEWPGGDVAPEDLDRPRVTS